MIFPLLCTPANEERRTNNVDVGPRVNAYPCILDGSTPSSHRGSLGSWKIVTRYEIIVRHTKDNVGFDDRPGRVERVSGPYWSGFLLDMEGRRRRRRKGPWGGTHPCVCSVQNGRRDPIVPSSLFLCRWDIRARARTPADRRTDGHRTSPSFPLSLLHLTALILPHLYLRGSSRPFCRPVYSLGSTCATKLGISCPVECLDTFSILVLSLFCFYAFVFPLSVGSPFPSRVVLIPI